MPVINKPTLDPDEDTEWGFSEYQEEARRTMSGDPDLVTAALGLAGEAGEFADHLKKVLAQGHPFDPLAFIGEAGDILWYLSLAADALGTTLDVIARQNIKKLRARYPGGFTTKASLKRVG